MRGHLLFFCGPPSSIPAQSLDRNVFSPPCEVSSVCPVRSCARIRLAGDGTPPAAALQSIPFWIPDPEGEVSIVFTSTWSNLEINSSNNRRRPVLAPKTLACTLLIGGSIATERSVQRRPWKESFELAFWSRAHIGGMVAERFTQAGHGAALRSVS